MKTFGGPVLFLDRSDINTDEIIPAKYLEETDKKAIKPYLLEDLKINGFNPQTDVAGKRVIITRDNFGCGNEKPQAAVALTANSLHSVISAGIAKNFRSAMYANDILSIEMDKKSLADMFHTFADKDTECKVVINDDGSAKVKLYAGSLSKSYPFQIGETDKVILDKEDWLGYTETNLKY
ncbi:MAG: 3-isopropylmalate dehydratase small subunit [Treponema sp.]|nr:3-isopropylmalate dehydratase small subunit [Treponema sp.]